MTSYGTISPSPPIRSPTFPRFHKSNSHNVLKTAENSSPMHVHGHGVLSNLITSHTSHNGYARDDRISSLDHLADEEQSSGDAHGRRSGEQDRRLSAVLNTPQMRSMRLIGSSNPRYQWEKYWKTEDQLKTMKKPMWDFLRDDSLQPS